MTERKHSKERFNRIINYFFHEKNRFIFATNADYNDFTHWVHSRSLEEPHNPTDLLLLCYFYGLI